MVAARAVLIGELMLDLAATVRQYEAATAVIHQFGRLAGSLPDDLPGAIRRRRENHDLILTYVQRARDYGIDLARVARTLTETCRD